MKTQTNPEVLINLSNGFRHVGRPWLQSISVAVAIGLQAVAVSGALPEGPRVILQINPDSLQATGRVHVVEAGADLQKALDAAQPGDQIVLQAGETYVGNFVLPKKTGQGWVTIRSSASKRLPPKGGRVRPEHARAMPKLVSPNGSPALSIAPGGGFYRVTGVEITHADEVKYNGGLVVLGGNQSRLEDTPHDLVFDQVYVHGHPRSALKRGFALNSARTVIANSWISDCHVDGQDAQAIGGWNGSGPFKIENNYLEGSGENLMFGGADPAVPGLVPADIEIKGNHLLKPLAWRERAEPGTRWTVKNLFELKNARRVIVEGNVMEYSWVHGQTGFGILLTPRNQGGKAPWCVVEDVAFINNIVRHCSSGISVLAEDDNHRSDRARRLLFRNNLFADINPGRFGGDGRMLQLLSPRGAIEDLILESNTLLHGGRGNTFICFDGPVPVAKGLVFRNNIVTRGQYGIHSSRGMGLAGLQVCCDGFEVIGNLIIGEGGARGMPDGNRFAATVSEAGMKLSEDGDLRIEHANVNAAANVEKAGADLEALAKAAAAAISGIAKPSS